MKDAAKLSSKKRGLASHKRFVFLGHYTSCHRGQGQEGDLGRTIGKESRGAPQMAESGFGKGFKTTSYTVA